MSFAQLQSRCRAARERGREPVALFDLDGTLYDNTWRTLRILHEYAVRHAIAHPELYDAVMRLHAHGLEYRLSDALARVGVTDAALIDGAFRFWRERFFTNTYQAFDLPLPGAVELVNRMREAGAVIAYFTGRDAPNMLLGTVSALQRDGFPIGTADTHVILKPTFEQDDSTYKSETLEHVRRLGEVIAAFDNEPGLVNRFREAFPEAAVYHLQTSWAPTSEPQPLLPGVHAIGDFRGLMD